MEREQNVHFYFHFPEILQAFGRLTKELKKIMATLDELVSAAEAEDTKIDGLIALVEVLKAKVDEALEGVLTPAQQAKVDAIFAAVGDNPQRIQDAIDANTPAGP